MKFKLKNKKFLLELIVFFAIIIIDRISKIIFTNLLRGGKTISVIGDFVTFAYVTNTGAAFGSMEGQNILFFVFTATGIIFFGYLIYAERNAGKMLKIALVMMLAGALGNAADRAFNGDAFFNGYVTDFISVKYFAVFNIADSALVVGVGLFAAFYLFVYKPDKKPGGLKPDGAPEGVTEDAGKIDKADGAGIDGGVSATSQTEKSGGSDASADVAGETDAASKATEAGKTKAARKTYKTNVIDGADKACKAKVAGKAGKAKIAGGAGKAAKTKTESKATEAAKTKAGKGIKRNE
jgi:signal peptidase II